MKSPGKSLKVLIVEDSEDDTLLLLDELKRGGFDPAYKRVETRQNYIEELSKDWDLIIADYSLPRFSGDEALKVLNKSGRDIPLIVISGSITEEMAVSLLKSGVKDFITKNNLSRLAPVVQREISEASVRKTQSLLKQALWEKEELIDAFFNSANEAFVLLDNELKYVQVNPGYERRMGLTNEELRGRRIAAEFPEIESSGRLAQYINVMKTGEPLTLSNVTTHLPLLGERVVNIYAFKVGECLGLIITDVTEQKKLEKEREEINRLNKSLAKLYIPLTNPETSIRDIADMILVEAKGLTQSPHGYVSEVDELTGANICHTLTSMMHECEVPGKQTVLPKNSDGSYPRLWGYSLTKRKPFFTNNPRAHKASRGVPTGHASLIRYLSVPVLISGKLVGQIFLANSPRDYDENDLKTIERLAEFYGTAMQRKRIEAALRRDEAEKISILTSIKDPVSIVDREYRFLWGNDALSQLFGKPLEDIVGKKCHQAAFNSDHPCDECVLQDVFDTGVGKKVILQYQKGIHYATYLDPVRDESGKTVSIIEIYRDITDLINYEKRLEALHEHSLTLASAKNIEEISNISLGIMSTIFNFKFMIFLEVRESALVGVASIGAPLGGFKLPLNGKGITVKAANTGKSIRINDLRGYKGFVKGSTDSLSELAVPVLVDDQTVAVLNAESDEVNAFSEQDQKLLEILGSHVASTITRLKGEEELAESETKYRNLFNGVNDAVFIHSLDGRFLEVNDVACQQLGYTRDELLKIRLEDLDFDSDAELVSSRIDALKREGHLLFEVTHLHKDGRHIDAEVNARLVEYEGSPAVLSTCRDIRERKKMEKGLTALHDVATKLAYGRTLNEVWDITLNTLDLTLGKHWANIGAVQDGYLKYVKGNRLSQLPSLDKLPLNGSGITARAAKTGMTQRIPDVRIDPDYVPSFTNTNETFPTLSELAVPVAAHGEVYAVINLESETINDFSTEDQRLAEILAGHMAEAIDRILSIEEMRIGEEQLATLHKFTNRLAEAQAIDEAATVAADSIKTLLNTPNGSLSFVEGGALHHRYVYGTEPSEEYVQPLDGLGITIRAAVTGESQLVHDVREDMNYQLPEGVEIATRSELAVPVKLEGRVVAVINAESPVIGVYTLKDQQILEILSMHLGSAFARIKDNESKERYRIRLEALYKLVVQLNMAQTTTKTAAIATDMIQSLYRSEYARVALIEGEELVAISIPGGKPKIAHLPLNGRGVTVQAAKEKRTIYVEDTEKDPNFIKGGINALSELVVPLMSDSQVVGVLNIESTRRNAFTPEDIKLAETLALHISATLERLRLDAERMETQITLQRKEHEAEQVKELEGLKTRFISTATHEIRTPLTSIKGYTDLIRGELGAGNINTSRRYFDVVERNVDRLVHLTDDLLNIQRIEEGRINLNMTTFEARAILMDLIAEMTPLLSRRNQTLEISKKLNGKIRGDRNRLMQVLVNLVANASKFSPEGSLIQLSVAKRGRDALFSLRDSGVGLTEEDVPKLFKPFPGIHVEGNPAGTGLGLSICRGIVELHGGSIWAESEGRGKGSTFHFTIPEDES